MDEQITFRPATADDARGIATVHVASWQSTYAGILPEEFLANLSADARETLWKDNLSHDDYGKTKFAIVAEVAGRVIGFADGGPARNASGCDCEIFAIYLLGEYQQQGLGKELMSQLADKLVAAGFRTAIVGVLADNPSRGFYEKLGARYSHSQQISIAGVALEERFYIWPDIRVILSLME